MKVSKPSLLAAYLCGTFLVNFGALAQTPPVHKGIGVVRQDCQVRLATVEVLPAGVTQLGAKSNGTIAARLSIPPENYKGFAAGTSTFWPTTYKPTAKITVYKVDGQGNVGDLVYTGNMISMTGVVQVMPPSNSLREERIEYFESQINTGSRSGLNLYENGNYRAEVVFYIQEFGPQAGLAVGWEPTPIEVAGAAVEFTISDFALAPLAETRGEVSVSVSVVPRRGATPAQIAELQSLATREGSRASSSIRAFLNIHAQKNPAGSAARQPWFYSETVKTGGAPAWNFYIPYGQTYSSQVKNVQGELNSLVARGNISRTVPGGTFSVRTATNIRFFPK